MRNLPHLIAMVFGQPLLLHPSFGEAIVSRFADLITADARSPIPALAPAAVYDRASTSSAPQYADKPYTLTEGGVAVLPIIGPLVQRAGDIGPDCMPLASYQSLRGKINAAAADGDVRAILLELDSPGGQVAGMFDLAAHIRSVAATSGKPIWAHANEAAFSAGYGLASAAQRLHAPTTGSVGSIGVVAYHLDQSQRDARQGLVWTPIYAGARKVDYSSHAPLSKPAHQAAQAEINGIYDLFTAHVADTRGISQQAARDTEAATYMAGAAKALGLIDAVATFADTLAELTDHVRPHGGGGTVFPTGQQATHPPGAPPMASTPETPATAAPPAASPPTQPAAPTAADERSRIAAILALPAAATRPALAQKLALGTDLSPAAAADLLAAAAEEKPAVPPPTAAAPGPLATAMARIANPAVGADGAAGGDDSPAALAQNVVALYRATKGVAA